MKIAFFEIKDEEQTFFKSHLNSNHELFFFKETIQEVLKKTETYDIVSLFVNSRITDTVLEKLPNLSYLQTRSTGFEHLNCNMLYRSKSK
jgi:D-lactate dehydrogenase